MPGARKRRATSSRSRNGNRRAVPRRNMPAANVPENNRPIELADLGSLQVPGLEYVPEGVGIFEQRNAQAGQQFAPAGNGGNEGDDEWGEEVYLTIGEPEPGLVDTGPVGRPCFSLEGDVISESGKNYLLVTISFLN